MGNLCVQKVDAKSELDIDIDKTAEKIAEETYSAVKELCTPENAQKLKAEALAANAKLLENGIDLKAIGL